MQWNSQEMLSQAGPGGADFLQMWTCFVHEFPKIREGLSLLEGSSFLEESRTSPGLPSALTELLSHVS